MLKIIIHIFKKGRNPSTLSNPLVYFTGCYIFATSLYFIKSFQGWFFWEVFFPPFSYSHFPVCACTMQATNYLRQHIHSSHLSERHWTFKNTLWWKHVSLWEFMTCCEWLAVAICHQEMKHLSVTGIDAITTTLHLHFFSVARSVDSKQVM